VLLLLDDLRKVNQILIKLGRILRLLVTSRQLPKHKPLDTRNSLQNLDKRYLKAVDDRYALRIPHLPRVIKVCSRF